MKPLTGQRILLTRAAEDAAAWAAELAALGADPVVLPCIECHAIDTPSVRAALARALETSDWLVFTSRRGVEAFQTLHSGPVPRALKIAVVGPATADLAREALGRADLVSPEGTAASLGQALSQAAQGARGLLLVVAENAGPALERTLREAGLAAARVDAYRTVPAASETAPQALSTLGVDNVFLASPSAVVGFLQRVALDCSVDMFSIGPATSAAARSHGLEIKGEAREPTLAGLVEALQCAN